MFLANKLSGSGIPQKTYADDVFAAIPYAGSGATLNIPHTLGLLTPWLCSRSSPNSSSFLYYYHTGFLNNTNYYCTNSNAGPTTDSTYASGGGLTNNIPLGANSNATTANVNKSGNSYIAYCFKNAPKFHNFFRYSGSGGLINLDPGLGAAPALMFFKGVVGTAATANWLVWHKSFTTSQYLELNNSNAVQTAGSALFGSITASSVQIIGGVTATNLNNTCQYDFRVFADDTSADGLVRCGTYTGNGSTAGPSVDLGWEPQWLMVKNISGVGSWNIIDTSRGWTFDGVNQVIQADTTNAETTQNWIGLRSNGFQPISTSSEVNSNGATYLYLAVRKSNKPPTSGSQVLNLQSNPASSGYAAFGVNVPASNVDLLIHAKRGGDSRNFQFADRVRGLKSIAPTYPTNSPFLSSSSASGEVTSTSVSYQRNNLAGYRDFIAVNEPVSGDYLDIGLKRAAGFFDIAAYKGSSSVNVVVPHNLQAVPELIITKCRDISTYWGVRVNVAGGSTSYQAGNLHLSSAFGVDMATINIGASSYETVWYGGSHVAGNYNYVSYLFATLPGISKVGFYVGDANATQTIDCGFTGGARFVLIKRVDAVGDWFLFDSARGITTGTDPSLLLNSTAAEVVSGTDIIQPSASGFTLGAGELRYNTATYLYLAIA